MVSESAFVLPIYLFRTRGLSSVVILVGAVLFFCLMVLGVYAGAFFVESIQG